MRRQPIAVRKREQGCSAEHPGTIVGPRPPHTLPRIQHVKAIGDDRHACAGLGIQRKRIAQLVEQTDLELAQNRFQVIAARQAGQRGVIEGEQRIVRIVRAQAELLGLIVLPRPGSRR